MKKIIITAFVTVLLFIAGCSLATDRNTGDGADIPVTIFKSASCRCCGIYSQYMDARGYDVATQNVETDRVKQQYGVPAAMQSCHTTIIGDYFVEGHVPSEAIQKLLSEKPEIKGIAMPGMPSGSPGMPGAKTGDFVIYAVHNDGSTSEFMRI